MPKRPLYQTKAKLFKALSHPARIQVLEVLAAHPDLTASVGELLKVTGLEPSALSQHLSVLKRTGLVESQRAGNLVDYKLTEPLVAELLVVSRAFLLLRLLGHGEIDAYLPALRAMPAIPGASAQATLEAAITKFNEQHPAGTPATAESPQPDHEPATGE